MSDSYFNEENDYSEENASDNEDFRTTCLQPFQFEPEQEKSNLNHEKETEHSHASVTLQQPIYQVLGLKCQLVQIRALQKRSERNRFSLL